MEKYKIFHVYFLPCLAVFNFLLSQSNCNVIKFTLSAKDLPNRDIDGASDPIARMWKAEGNSSSFNIVGETEKIDNNPNPVWNKTFIFRYAKGTNQRWRFFIKDWDLDCAWLFEDFLGRVEIDVDEYVLEVEKTNGATPMELPLTHPTGGTLCINPISSD